MSLRLHHKQARKPPKRVKRRVRRRVKSKKGQWVSRFRTLTETITTEKKTFQIYRTPDSERIAPH